MSPPYTLSGALLQIRKSSPLDTKRKGKIPSFSFTTPHFRKNIFNKLRADEWRKQKKRKKQRLRELGPYTLRRAHLNTNARAVNIHTRGWERKNNINKMHRIFDRRQPRKVREICIGIPHACARKPVYNIHNTKYRPNKNEIYRCARGVINGPPADLDV